MEGFRPSLFLLRRGVAQSLNSSTTSPLRHHFSTSPATQKPTTARTKRALNIPPHSSFLEEYGSADQLIFNPPASAPSVYNTPYIFLPRSDPRRRAGMASHLFADRTNFVPPPTRLPETQPNEQITITGSSSSSQTQRNSISATQKDQTSYADIMPPPVKDRYLWPKQQNHTQEDVREIQRLRQSDPEKWTVPKLAAKFKCSSTFIMNCGSAPDAHKRALKEKAARMKARWGPYKTRAREDRSKRKNLLMQGKL